MKKILVVEGDADAAALRARALGADNYTVAGVSSGQEAVAAVREDSPPVDLVLMDLDLAGEMGGINAARQIRAIRDVPIIFLVSRTGKELIERTGRIVNYGYVEKSSGDEILIATVRTAFRLHEALRALRESEEKYSKAFHVSPDAVTINRLSDGMYVAVNEGFTRITGYTPGEVIGRLSTSLGLGVWVNDEDRMKLAGAIERDGDVAELEAPFHRKDRSIFVGLMSARRVAIDGEPCILSITRDITAWKRDQTQLRKLSRAVEQSASSIIITDLEGNIEYVNPKFTQVTGYAADEVIGKNPRVLKSGATPPEEYARLWQIISAGGEWRGEFHNRRKNGELFWESASISPVKDPGGAVTHYLAVKEDITARKEMELRMREMETMESLGVLAGGVAHDFNNILGIILGHVTLLESRRHEKATFEQSIRAINSAIQRGAGIVRQILTFARKSEVHPQAVDVNRAVEDLARMIEETFPRTVELALELGQAIPTIRIDSTQLHQALLNLCINARDSMMEPRGGRPPGGKLTIRTRLVDGAVVAAHEGADAALKYVEICVADEGGGMSDATIQRIFEPFFTTKELGRGTGIGLSLVYGVARTHGGFVDVDSRLGEGTVFRLYFPAGGSEPAVDEGRTVAAVPLSGKGEGILIVEDEQPLLDLLEPAFLDRGYRVFTARDGMEGIAVYRDHSDDIAMVLTDYGLPKADGAAVLKSLQVLNPSVRVVVASGFFEPTVRRELMKRGVRALVAKPYAITEVLGIVRKVLDTP